MFKQITDKRGQMVSIELSLDHKQASFQSCMDESESQIPTPNTFDIVL